jgi:NodT family efflux transporter outer membrane factor (OMF) lipoprotein
MSDGAGAPGTRSGRRALRLCLLLGLAACPVGPDFQRPDPPSVQVYAQPEGGTQAPTPPSADGGEAAPRVAIGQRIPAQWWGLFHSSRLDEMLRLAIANNQSLAAAKATLAQAQEAIVQAQAGLYPQASLGASARSGKPVAGLPSGLSNLFSVGPSVSYAVDAFGGTRRQVEEQRALAQSQAYQVAAAHLALTGNFVTQAIAIASTRLQVETVEELIRNDEKNLDLVEREFNAGKVAKVDALTAAAQLAGDKTQLPALHQQLSVARHALAILANKLPAEWTPPDLSIEEFQLPEELPLSLPSEFVRQRPDILAAEATLHADSAAIGVATAQMFPSLTLSASLLQEAQSLGGLFSSGATAWSAGGSLSVPIFEGGAQVAGRRAAIDAYNAQLATYRVTVLAAFQQVADTLSALEHDAEMVSVSRSAVEIAGRSLAMQRSSFLAGKTSALQLIVAENTYSSARLGYARSVGQRLTDTTQLFVAVGGGWWNSDDLAWLPQ